MPRAGGPDPHEHARQRGFAGGGWSDHPKRLAGRQREVDVLADDPVLARRRDGSVLHDERPRRRFERHRLGSWRQVAEQTRQALPALPRADKAAPIGDRQIHRSQGARSQDGSGDHDSGCRLLIDNEIGADRQNRRLQQHPQDLGKCTKPAAHIAGAAARSHEIVIELVPVLGDASCHPHRGDGFGIAAARLQKRIARRRELGGAACRAPGLDLGYDRQCDQDDGAGERGQA